MGERRELTVTVVVEHDGGPYAEEYWEQDVPFVVERALRDADLDSVGKGAQFRIADVTVEDVTEVQQAR
jgi:hypothetical protein